TALPTADITATASVAATGTADGTGSRVDGVLVSIFDPNINKYWNQATGAFDSANELQFSATVTPGTGNTASWSLPYTGPNGAFDVRAVVTDVAGNEGTKSDSVVFGP